MIPIAFDDQNVTYAENQKEYQPLPAHKSGSGIVTSCWKLTPEELETIQRTGVVWLQNWTFNAPLQPLRLSTEQPVLEP